MIRSLFIMACLVFLGSQRGYGQSAAMNQQDFFNDTSVLHATLLTNLDDILSKQRQKGRKLPGKFIITRPDGATEEDPVTLEVSGVFRLEFCFIPPMNLKFNSQPGSMIYPLSKAKLVNTCKTAGGYDQYLLKEYLIYRIYNLLTDKSCRVRLVELTFQDSLGKRKKITEFGFLLEDIKDVATRNNCKVWKKEKTPTEATDHHQMTLLSVFEYMIGNTDWAVPALHNVKLMVPKGDTLAKPFPVPHDFDYSGLVNAYYAVPDEQLKFANVKQRQYLGFPRTTAEMEEILTIYREQKPHIYDLINQFHWLNSKNKEEMIGYLNEFFDMIGHPGQVKFNLIENAMPQ